MDVNAKVGTMNRKKILITGSSGLVGSIIRTGIEDKYDVIGLDKMDHLNTDHIANSAHLNDIYSYFDGVDTVIDLASNPDQFSSWDEIYKNNLLCTYNCLEAALSAGVKRVIFASSNHATGMYEFDEPYRSIVSGDYDENVVNNIPLITTEMPIRPDGPYGIGKAFGEAAGRYFSDQHNISVFCLRIGTVNKENRPVNIRQYATLLSHEDLVRLVKSCIEAPIAKRFGIYYGVSNNKWRFWDLSNSHSELGYSPKDNAELWRTSESI
tara:strand:- start:900 stop:1700 length:801 start_codon:yes stop_codon:yes gene_type:complete